MLDGNCDQRRLGAFYTPARIACELTKWAVREEHETVLDPSFGGCAFLAAAVHQFKSMGLSAEQALRQIAGVELNDDAYMQAVNSWEAHGSANLVLGDFLSMRPGDDVPVVDIIVGNPPYLRFQKFDSPVTVAASAGVSKSMKLSGLASSWASFVMHAVNFIRPGGRLAFVLPAQLLHAQYSAVVRSFLLEAFGRVVVIGFDKRIFPGTQEEVVLLLGDRRGETAVGLEYSTLASLDDLNLARFSRPTAAKKGLAPRGFKPLAKLLPYPARVLYSRLERSAGVVRLGQVASLELGTVTGANSFFMLSGPASRKLHPALLQRAVGRAAQIKGAVLSTRDYDELLAAGGNCFLLVASGDQPDEVLESAESYFKQGEREGLHNRFKCRNRDPWWSVRLPKCPVPSLLLTSCAHRHPRLVLNEAQVMYTNTLYGVTTFDASDAPRLAAAFYNSLSMLSVELLARSYGGGVLKLEPSEAKALLIPYFSDIFRHLQLSEIDAAIRAGDLGRANERADEALLASGLGLSFSDILLLREAAEGLRRRRLARRQNPRREEIHHRETGGMPVFPWRSPKPMVDEAT